MPFVNKSTVLKNPQISLILHLNFVFIYNNTYLLFITSYRITGYKFIVLLILIEDSINSSFRN